MKLLLTNESLNKIYLSRKVLSLVSVLSYLFSMSSHYRFRIFCFGNDLKKIKIKIMVVYF